MGGGGGRQRREKSRVFRVAFPAGWGWGFHRSHRRQRVTHLGTLIVQTLPFEPGEHLPQLIWIQLAVVALVEF
eukprot:6317386-Prymnesium_polylepis.2